MPKFRMIHVDHYMCEPVVPFDDTKSEATGLRIKKVPVIRIFGADLKGHKICIHVHGFYPYVAIQNRDPSDPELDKRLLRDIQRALGQVAEENNQKWNQRRQDRTSNGAGAGHQQHGQQRHQHQQQQQAPQQAVVRPETGEITDDPEELRVRTRVLQERRPLVNYSDDLKSPIHRIERLDTFNYYGYHHKAEPFFKLHIYQPRMIKQFAQIFEDCKVFERFVPVFWAHLPYLLLFFIDNNLRGMQFIEFDQLYWRNGRAPRRESQLIEPSQQTSGPAPTPVGGQAAPGDTIEEFTTEIEPMSTCELEADARFEWILNRHVSGNDEALRELWLDDQETTQSSKSLETELPLYQLEYNYLEQLCDSLGVNFDRLRLKVSETARRLRPKSETPSCWSSDDSQELLSREDLDEPRPALPAPPRPSKPIGVTPDEPQAGPSGISRQPIAQTPSSKQDDEEWNDDDDEIISAHLAIANLHKMVLPKTEPLKKSESEAGNDSATSLSPTSRVVKRKPSGESQESSSFVQSSKIGIKREPAVKTEPRLSEQLPAADSEFSDSDDEATDQLLLKSLIKLEAENSQLKSEPSSQPVAPQSEIPDPSPTTPSKAVEAPDYTPQGPTETPLAMASCSSSAAKDLNAPRQLALNRRYSDNSMIDGPSILNTTNQSITRQNTQRSVGSQMISHEYQFLCTMSMELHISTRGKLRPDPAHDSIEAVFYCVRNDLPEESKKPQQIVGVILTDLTRDADLFQSEEEAANCMDSPASDPSSPEIKSSQAFQQGTRRILQNTGLSLQDIELSVVGSEFELIIKLVDLVKSHDPEILLGYEMERLSWGYIIERSTVLNLSVSIALSRVIEDKFGHNSTFVESNFVQPIMFTGRMVFSVWRIIKHEINLKTSTFEGIYHHALNERVPLFSFETLTQWFYQSRNRWRVIDYYLTRVVGEMRILDKFDLMTKVSELARVYGTQFIDVITRGSQIGIESMMLRLAKLQNLTPLSPTVMQRNKMRAPEALPLVMEPETDIYYDPIAVLDFHSLYPSVVVAYNYCYSTCLGRVFDIETGERHQFGASHLHIERDEIRRLLETNNVHVAPCGVAYVKKDVRRGILPKMLSELVTTRAMVKDQMKKNSKSERPNRRLQRILDHRQHGLKMMANTTYGYAGASYTGRMPCVEIADSIVSKGRETLENAIDIVESRPEWGAKVVYGDTDSIFIEFKGVDRDTAFKRSYEMVEAITAANPYPIKMKFEKIYQPCLLQTKKRYCGFKYESPDQREPEFEAKGIETIRRDCCPAAARMLEMALRIQFTTRDVNEVKKYIQHQFVKIMAGKVSNLQDFIFARQYKPRNLDKAESVFVPAWQITKRLLASDPRAEPRLNERVPFIIVYGEPGATLVNLARTPIEVLEDSSSRVNADYYIQKIICPTLNRVFCTMGVDTLDIYKAMSHRNAVHRSHYLVAQKQQSTSNFGVRNTTHRQSTMSQFFKPSHCPVCAKSIPVSDDICEDCRDNLEVSVVRMKEEISKSQRELFEAHQICRNCCSLERVASSSNHYDCSESEYHQPCISHDCPNLFRYHQAKLDTLNSNYLEQILKNLKSD